MIQEMVVYIKEHKFISFLVVGILSLLIIFVMLYKFQENKQSIPSTSLVNSASSTPQSFNSTFDEKKRVLQDYDEQVAVATDKNVINSLLLNKMSLLTATRGSTDLEFLSSEEIKKVYTNIYSDKNSLLTHKAFTVLGYINHFISRCFYSPWAEALPEPFLSQYQSETRKSTVPVEEKRTDDQRIAFSVFSDFADNNPNAGIFKNDKSLVSYRLFMNAVYYESFSKTIKKDELLKLSDRIKKDAVQFPTTDVLSYRNRSKSILMPAMFYAYGYDIYRSLVLNDKSNEANSQIDKNYENVYPLTSNPESVDKVSDGIVSAFNSLFYISSLERRYGYDNKSQKIEEIVNLYESGINSAAEVREVLAGYMRYSLDSYGEWNATKKYAFSVAAKSEKLNKIFNSHGVSDENIKKLSKSK